MRTKMTVLLTIAAMIAFAANSILCRMALAGTSIDPATFTLIRIISGAVTLYSIVFFRGFSLPSRENKSGPIALFVYAICFSYAYGYLGAGTGALILFGAVQLTMMVSALRSGDTLSRREWVGFISAILGLVYLLLPGLEAPSIKGGVLMAFSGVAWGVYTLEGRGATNAVALTAENFIRATPIAVISSIGMYFRFNPDSAGVLYAVLSGALTSGLGYVIWYSALSGLTTMRAAIVQLSVPVIASAGGVLFLSEMVTMRLLLSGVFVLGGIALALTAKNNS